ncbi:RNA polymerase recycling motor ATPase HelR [Ornithinimicrobium humiphilum]|nr:RNA polymerase recycling motor ATPase HelR [Ornithinimicrobium humiphilum]
MTTTTVFDLTRGGRDAVRDHGLVAADEAHLAAVADAVGATVAELEERLAQERRAPAGLGQQALERDQQVHRLSARLRTLQRFGADLCLGRMVLAGQDEPVYVGRLGLTDREGRRLLVDWRSPAAEPFFGATWADPMGLVSRRRYRWTGGRVTDFWDEVFTTDPVEGVVPDEESSFLLSLGTARTSRMRDVLATLQADQDAIIRAGSRGTLVVDGGPGTGKTVVALHRAAYLLYADPRLGHHRGGVLFVGPHEPYLSWVADVLPGLGEEGVQTCTLRDLVPEGAVAREEDDPRVALLKASAELVRAVEPAVQLYEEPPTEPTSVTTELVDVVISPEEWAEAFGAREAAVPHNEAREEILEELVAILVDRLVDADDDTDPDRLRASLLRSPELRHAVARAWPLIEPTDLVGDLWTVPAYLRRCAPGLTLEEVRALQREDPQAWTTADLPLLDAARLRLGDVTAGRRRQRRAALQAAERARMDDVVEHLVATDDSEMQVMSMLRGRDLQAALVDADAAPAEVADRLAGPFLHVVVDEAQELTDAQWQMLLRRCPSRSFTVVGDRAQAREGFPETWEERLARVGLDRVEVRSLTVNYRTPVEVMEAAEPVVRAVLPDANVPVSVRSTGLPVLQVAVEEVPSLVDRWLAEHAEGTVCVLGDPAFPEGPRVRSLTPVTAKGMEFDLVVLVRPQSWGAGTRGAVDRYVAMTRATRQLVVAEDSPAVEG